MDNKETLFLCFYGDGPLWDNIPLIVGYPYGYSYYRPFRYRNEWFQEKALNEYFTGKLLNDADFMDEQEYKKSKGKEAFLCMRFIGQKNIWEVLPIRKVRIEHIDPMPDNQSVYFSMGPMYDFTEVKELSDACLSIDSSQQSDVGKTLFFKANLDINIDKFKKEKEDDSWASFADLIVQNKNLPINTDAKSGIFIRLHGMSSEKDVGIKVINESRSSGVTRGLMLTEGESYELVFYHRVPFLTNKNKSIKKALVKYKVPSGNLELSRSEEELTGNYQKHIVNVSALKPSGTHEEIIIELPEKIESQDGKTKVNALNIHIPLKVKKSHCYRLKRTYIWLVLIWATLFINVLIGYRLDDKSDWGLIIASGIVAIGSAIGVYILQQRGTNK